MIKVIFMMLAEMAGSRRGQKFKSFGEGVVSSV
jgi:hypothetical protein